MYLNISDIKLDAELPELPATIPVFTLSAPSIEDRQEAIIRLSKYFKLGRLRSAEMKDSFVMASPRGSIQYFPASGAVLARDATAQRNQENELCNWGDLQKTDSPDNRLALSPEAARRLIGQAQELLEPLGLLGKEHASATVQLLQVAHIDNQGNEIEYGAGKATVKFGYAVEGRRVQGAGAKTLAFAVPRPSATYIFGIFHAWRNLGQATTIKLPGIEKALGVGVLSDPELNLYHQAGHELRITRLELVYLALPAFMRQSHLFPAFQVEGQVSEGKNGIGFNFARFHHAAPPSAYNAAGLVGSYLTINPDGIKPLPRPKRKA